MRFVHTQRVLESSSVCIPDHFALRARQYETFCLKARQYSTFCLKAAFLRNLAFQSSRMEKHRPKARAAKTQPETQRLDSDFRGPLFQFWLQTNGVPRHHEFAKTAARKATQDIQGEGLAVKSSGVWQHGGGTSCRSHRDNRRHSRRCVGDLEGTRRFLKIARRKASGFHGAPPPGSLAGPALQGRSGCPHRVRSSSREAEVQQAVGQEHYRD